MNSQLNTPTFMFKFIQMIYIIVSADDYKDLIKNNPFVLIEFKAKWCHSSNMIAPFCQLLSEKYCNLKFANLDVDYIGEKNLERLDLNLNLGAIPAFYLYKNGELLDKLIGGSHAKLETFIETYYTGEINRTSNSNYENSSISIKKNGSEINLPVWSSVRPRTSNITIPKSPTKKTNRAKSAKPNNNNTFTPATNNNTLAANHSVFRSHSLHFGRYNTT